MHDFKPGLYKHYRGGFYTALFLVAHHETREPMVIYTSHTYGGVNARPLHGWSGDSDGWNDWMPEHNQHRFAGLSGLRVTSGQVVINPLTDGLHFRSIPKDFLTAVLGRMRHQDTAEK